MKYLKNMKHIYAERLFGMAIGLFIAAILMNNRQTTYGTIITVYTLVALSIVSSLVIGIMAYIDSYGETRAKSQPPLPEEDLTRGL